MKKSLNLLFWGYIFVYLRIEVLIDLLPDPLGYLFIALGCYKLQEKLSVDGKAHTLSTMMIFISLPTIFVDVHQALGWEIYSNVLIVLNLILVYFIFSIFKEIVQSVDHEELSKHTTGVFNVYMVVHLIYLTFLSFSVNLSENIMVTVNVVLTIATIVMNIAFLVLIRAIRKNVPLE